MDDRFDGVRRPVRRKRTKSSSMVCVLCKARMKKGTTVVAVSFTGEPLAFWAHESCVDELEPTLFGALS